MLLVSCFQFQAIVQPETSNSKLETNSSNKRRKTVVESNLRLLVPFSWQGG